MLMDIVKAVSLTFFTCDKGVLRNLLNYTLFPLLRQIEEHRRSRDNQARYQKAGLG